MLHRNAARRYFIGFICGSFHLLVDPALELIRVAEKLLQVERVGQLGPATHGSLVKGVAAAQQLKDKSHVNLCFLLPRDFWLKTRVPEGRAGDRREGTWGAPERTASRRVATSSMA